MPDYLTILGGEITGVNTGEIVDGRIGTRQDRISTKGPGDTEHFTYVNTNKLFYGSLRGWVTNTDPLDTSDVVLSVLYGGGSYYSGLVGLSNVTFDHDTMGRSAHGDKIPFSCNFVANGGLINGAAEAHTAGDTLTAAEAPSTHTNYGATGSVTLVLPATVDGAIFKFCVLAGQTLRIDPNAADQITVYSGGLPTQLTAGYYIESSTIGNQITLEGDGTDGWTAISQSNAWAVEVAP